MKPAGNRMIFLKTFWKFSADHLMAVVNDVLDFNKMNSTTYC